VTGEGLALANHYPEGEHIMADDQALTVEQIIEQELIKALNTQMSDEQIDLLKKKVDTIRELNKS